MDIWVIMGGMSAERAVSLDSGAAVSRALNERGHRVWAYDLRSGAFLPDLSSAPLDGLDVPTHSYSCGWAGRLLRVGAQLRERIDLVFPALHGGEGEGGVIQALLGILGIPFAGSGHAASAICLDKMLSKRIMEALEIPTPPWTVVGYPPDPTLERIANSPVGGLPLVVKPIAEGSSVGVGIVRRPEEWPAALRAAAGAAAPGGQTAQLLVERYIPGRELTVGLLGRRPLPVLEIRPRSGFYDYQRKYTPGESEYLVPAELEEGLAEKLRTEALRLFTATGCRGMARVDYRLSPAGKGYCLELNTIPGLTATSLLPKAAAAVGYSFGAMLEEICRAALAGGHAS